MCAERTVTIELGKCTNLHASRGETFTAFARVELGLTSLGESAKKECKDEECDINYTTSLKVATNNPASFDNLIKQPLLVSVIEVLPRDKKAKEDKTNLLGQANIDLLPLLKGQTVISDALALFYPSFENHNKEPAVLDIKISVPKPLLTPTELSKSNILTLRVRGLYSPPHSWSPGASFPYTVTVAIPKPIPVGGELSPLAIAGGELKSAVEPDHAQLCGQWWWAGLPHTGMASLVSDSAMISTAVEDEKGGLKAPQDIEFRRSAETSKPRVAWNTEIRTFLSPNVTSSFLKNLSKNFLWPVEVGRLAVPSGGKGKAKDDEGLSFHALSLIDLSSLLYPGVERVCGAYSILPFNESVLDERTQHNHYQSVLEVIHPHLADGGGPGRKSIQVGGPGKRSGTAMRVSTASFISTQDGGGKGGDELANAYVEARSYLWLEIELMTPLVAKRPASAIAKRTAEYIPPRAPLKKKVLSTEVAVSDLHSVAANVADMLLAEYRNLFGDEIADGGGSNTITQEQYKERYRQLIYHLNSSGRYHAFKEHIKRAVVQLVRLKFLNEASTKDPEKLQSFLSELYTYLMDEVHKGLAEKVFALEGPKEIPQSPLDCEDLQVFAAEAEDLEKYELAEHYYKELLVRDSHTPSYWYRYGVFSLRMREFDRAEQCFKQAISLDQQYVPGLLLYGMCCSLDERFAEGSEFLELATTIDEKNEVTWTFRGLFYELAVNPVLRDMCYEAAMKLTSLSKKTFVAAPSVSKSTEAGDTEDIKEREVETIAPDAVEEKVEVQEEEQVTAHVDTTTQEGDPARSDLSPRGGGGGVADGASAGDGSSVQQSDTTTVVQIKESVDLLATEGAGLMMEDKQEEVISPFIKTAAYLLDVHAVKFTEMCLAHELTSPNSSDEVSVEEKASVSYCVTVARLHLLLGNFPEAQRYLKSAITKEMANSNAWALLGDSYYLPGNYEAALDAYERVVEYAQPPAHLHIILLRLADIYIRNKMYEKAKETSLRTCRKSPTSIGWRGVGIACFELGQLDEAEDALCEANILNNLDPIVWAYISLLCKATDRHSEAEQARKFAVKTGLDDRSLMKRLQL